MKRMMSLVVFCTLWPSLEGSDRLNLVLLISDDCTYTDTQVYGGQARTPHMMTLASEGMRFDNCFQAAPMCSPTRHALYTSLYPVKSGAHPNHTYVYDGVRSVAHWLKDAGYRVALSGKTHINPPEAFPFEYSRIKENNSTNPDFAAVEKLIRESRETGNSFGLFLCSNEPHTPWNHGDPTAYPETDLRLPPISVDTPELREAFPRYLAEITYFDSLVGEALRLIDKYGFRDNTMVVLITEQGNSLPFAKWTCYDKGLRSGLIVRWPGNVQESATSEALVEYIDIVPTFLEAAGLEIPARIDGRSFLPVLRGSAQHHKDFVFGIQTTRGINYGSDYYGIRSVRDSRYRFILNLTPEATFRNAATRGAIWESWKRVAAGGNEHAREIVHRYQHRPGEELYDCIEDPWNLKNLAADLAFREVKARLYGELKKWMKSQGDLGQETELAATKRLWRNRKQ